MRSASFIGLSTLLHHIHRTLQWVGDWLSDSVLTATEEVFKSIARGWFTTGGRWIHQASAFFLSIFQRQSYSRSHRRSTTARTRAWERFWDNPRGTFNAIFERELCSNSGDASPTTTASKPPPPITTTKTNSTTWRTRPFWPKRTPSDHDLNTASTRLFATSASHAVLTTAAARRGLLEDARLVIEVGIARLFSFLRNITRTVFFVDRAPPSSPFAHPDQQQQQQHPQQPRQQVGLSNPHRGAWSSLHVWTASDAILRAGYPLEEHTVTTTDGYVLQLHRIPRRGCRDVAFFQHGVLDTSLGWVANGAGRSAAFVAYEDGFDVWLSNSRSNPPRINVKPSKQGARYWHYSSNELAMCDLTAQLGHIHSVKMAEVAGEGVSSARQSPADFNRSLSMQQSDGMHRSGSGSKEGSRGIEEEETVPPLRRSISTVLMNRMPQYRGGIHTPDDLSPDKEAHIAGESKGVVAGAPQEEGVKNDAMVRQKTAAAKATQKPHPLPYRLQAVGHSLGAACLLMYCVNASMRRQPHRICRLVLLSPAGFHPRMPLAVRPCKYLMPWATAVVDRLRPGAGLGLRLPSPILRWITFKLVADLRRSPALLDLFKAALRTITSGDASEWHAAMELPHYAPQSMPAVSLHTACHFAQWAKDGNFRFYDYGRAVKNRRVYGQDVPPSVADHYHLLAGGGVPVDLAMGTSDGLIPPESVQCHWERLKAAGVQVTIKEFAYGHLGFTFGVGEDVAAYVLSRLRKSRFGCATSGGGGG